MQYQGNRTLIDMWLKLFLLLAALTGWYSLVAQLNIILTVSELAPGLAVLRFFSFFTILTNLLAAVFFTVRLLFPRSGLGIYFTRPSVGTAITAYMLFVGLAYTLLLRKLWNPQGEQRVVDELLHTVNPLVILIFWVLFLPGARFRWSEFLSWLIYPLLYMIYALVISPVIGLYPYPFLDAGVLGYGAVIRNGIGLLVFFSLIAIALIAFDRMLKRENV